jgi:tetratricopeptide (TPR) repeat protein
LIVQGAADLKAEKYDEALKKFESASKADPKDAEALYFEGAALNRLARPKEALEQLEKAGAMGFKGPGLAFDTGWALLRLARWIDAIVQLEYFEKTVPGRGKTSEFLGRAYLGLREYDKAESKLQEAIRRDPALKPTGLLFLAAIEQERKNLAAARVYLETLLREVPESPIAQTLRKEMQEPPRPVDRGV